MQINLSPELEKYLQSKVASGAYGNVSEMIGDALDLMREEEQRIERVSAAVQKGIDDIEAGRFVPCSKELMDEILQKALERAKSGEPIEYDPDVIGHGDDEPWGGDA